MIKARSAEEEKVKLTAKLKEEEEEAC